MYDFKQLLGFPFKEREWLMKMIMGTIIVVLPIINFLALGYFIRCIRCGWRGLFGLPEWEDWGELFRDGCMTLLILLFYLILPILVAFLLLPIPIVGTALASMAVFIMCIFTPMAIANYAIKRDMRDAFMLTEIFKQVARVSGFYIISYASATLGLIIGIALLFGVPFAGFVGGILIFYCGVVFFNFLGFLYREAH